MKKFILLTLLSIFFIVPHSFAQESPETTAKKYGVTFPIAELGNCASFSTCREYCEDATHADQCVSFAKKKGFYKETQNDSRKKEMMEAAKTQLGCTSETSCRETCQKEENFEKCSAFSQKHGVGEGPKGNPRDKNVLQKAQQILGCNSETSCKSVCEQDVNKDKCSEFAKQTGLGGGIKKVGPGGCNSEESCRTYCEKNRDECMKFGGGPGGGSPPPEAQRRGPGGCSSEESCKVYCEKNPDECRKFGGGPGGGSPQPESQRKGPGGCDSEESCKAYCEKNPQECEGNRVGVRSQEQSNQGNTREAFCRENPDKCRGQGTGEDMKRQPQERFQGQPPPEQLKERGTTQEVRSPEGQQFQPPSGGEGRTLERQGSQPPGGEFRPPEAQQPSSQEVRGAATSTTFFQRVLNAFLNR